MGKKALALLLCALMIIGFMPIKAHAAVISGDGYSYDDVTDILTISSNAIVNNWDNYEFVDYTQVKHLVIEDSVTNITSYAFYAWDTTSLESVIIGSGVTNIDGGAFTNNANLKSACFTGMNAPAFGAIAFDGCASSFSVYYPAGGKGYTSLGYTAQSPYGANVSVNGHIVITFNQQMNTSVNGTVTLGEYAG